MEGSIRILFLVFFVIGLAWAFWLLIEKQFHVRKQRFKHRFRMRAERISFRNFIIVQHIDRLLYLTAKDYQPGVTSMRFFLRSVYWFLVVLLILMLIGDFPKFTHKNPFLEQEIHTTNISLMAAFIVSLTFGLLPYIILRFRYSHNVVKASYDLAEVVKIMSRHSHLSISTALRRTAEDLPASNVLKRPLYVLANVFSSYSSFSELKSEALRFSSSIGTTFATQFVMDLLSFEKEGVQNFKSSLLFLNETMELQRHAILKVKEENQDAISLGLWVNAFVILLTSGFAVKFLTPRTFFKLLFQTDTGLYLFLFIIVSLVLSFFVSRILSRPKLDY